MNFYEFNTSTTTVTKNGKVLENKASVDIQSNGKKPYHKEFNLKTATGKKQYGIASKKAIGIASKKQLGVRKGGRKRGKTRRR